jgi:hypothetical protein
MEGLILTALLIAVTLFWWDTMRCKEIARTAGYQACQRAQVQFLDDTVEQKKLWLRRSPQGRLELCRLFFFEFTSDGERRYQGRIVTLGKMVSDIDMDAYRI